MPYKRPVSVLVVISAADSGRVLMLQRRDDPAFWQSVTGGLTLTDCQRCIQFEIFSHFRHRYAPEVTHNTEY